MRPFITLLDNEKILQEKQLKSGFIAYSTMSLTAMYGFFILLIGVMWIFYFYMKNGTINVFYSYFPLCLPGFLFFLAISYCILYFSFRKVADESWYIFTNQRCIIYSSKTETRTVEYSKIVKVAVSRGVIERLFGIATVVLYLGLGTWGDPVGKILGVTLVVRGNKGFLTTQPNRVRTEPFNITGFAYTDAIAIINEVKQYIGTPGNS